MKILRIPDDVCEFRNLRAGEEVLLNGVLLVARDQAHQRLAALVQAGQPLPIDIRGQVVFYMGPAPTPPGAAIGACGPTTAGRMDAFTPLLLRHGLAGMIGKGRRTPEVVAAMKETGAVYFYAYGGCGALYAEKVRTNELVAFADLGPEAIYRLTVADFPVLVAIDANGGSILEKA